MKRLFYIFCSVFMLAASALVGFSFKPSKNASFAVDDPATNQNEIIAGVSVTQSGHVFTMDDFELVGTTYYLYVNQNVSIIKDAVATTSLTVSVGINTYTREGANTEPIVLAYTATTAPVESNVTIELTSISTGISQRFSFRLIQTHNHFVTNPPYTWKDQFGATITAPTTAEQYNDLLTLNGLSGSTNCPVFIDLYYNGEFYSFYIDNTSGIFKSTISGNPIEDTDVITFATSGHYEVYIYDKTAYRMFKTVELKAADYNSNLPDNKKLTADVTFKCLDTSKIETVSMANIQSYSFNLQQTAGSANQYDMYITAADAAGKPVLYSQTVNDSVTLSFHNLSSQYVRRIEVHIDHKLIDGSTDPEDIDLARNQAQITELEKNGVTFTKDGDYRIYFYNAEGNKISPEYSYSDGTPVPAGRSYPMFDFTILTNIYKSYRGIFPEDLAGTSTVKENVIVSGTRKDLTARWYTSIKEQITSTTSTYLKGYNSSSFVLKLAKPNVRIDGISNGGSANDAVALTAHGVGKITVTVTKDNSSSTQTLTDGATISGTSEIGSYTIRLVDEMGSQEIISFTIKKSLNIATIGLIIAGAAILAIVIFIIVRLRTRIQVR